MNDLTDAAAAASMVDGFVRFDSKLKLCLLFKSDEFGVCGGVSKGLATSQKPNPNVTNQLKFHNCIDFSHAINTHYYMVKWNQAITGGFGKVSDTRVHGRTFL